jgi:hypothetical protein
MSAEGQIKRHVVAVIKPMGHGDFIHNDTLRDEVLARLARSGEVMHARPGSSGTLSWGLNKARRHLERKGLVVREGGGLRRTVPDPTVNVHAMLAYLRSVGPSPLTTIEAEAPPMPHLTVLRALEEYGLTWRVGRDWLAAEATDLDETLAPLVASKLTDAEVRT